MSRIVLAAALCLILPACSISPPTSAFSSLAKDEDKSGERATKQVRANGQPEEKTAGIGNSISNAWASVKSGLSFGGGNDDDAIGSDDKVAVFDAEQAQQLINNYRTQQGLRPLRLNPQLVQAAAEHSTDLSRNDRISHFGSDGSDTLERVKRAGYQARLTAENVGTGQRSLEEVIKGWKNSRDHNANLLLPDAEEMGMAMVNAPDTKFKTFWTMVIGAPIRVTN